MCYVPSLGLPVQLRYRWLGHHHVGEHVRKERFVLLAPRWRNNTLQLLVRPGLGEIDCVKTDDILIYLIWINLVVSPVG